MKIVKIIGGLGNQMFQYAFYLAHSKTDCSIKIDISEFEGYSLHQGFELSTIFKINTESIIATKEEIKQLKDIAPYFKIRKKIGSVLFSNPNQFIKNTHYIQPNYSVFYTAEPNQNNKYLDGYWQSQKYFEEIESDIYETFRWENIPQKNKQLAEQLAAENSIAIHIRRFDKPNNLKQLIYRIRLQLVWRVCKKKYYEKAISYFQKSMSEPKFYVFTDNIEWSRRIFATGQNFTIVDWNRGKESHWDMFLMSRCKHNIISMSSFSWWGAWLNQNPKKIVIAPKKWAVKFIKDIDLIPSSWIRI